MQLAGKKDIRVGDRRPFQGAVQISWQDRSGEMKLLRAKCLDLSDQGARIECSLPLEVRTSIYLQAPAFGLMRNATVRYCRRTGMKHIVGLMFSSVDSQADAGRIRGLTEGRGEKYKA